jgi:hypothetical protein
MLIERYLGEEVLRLGGLFNTKKKKKVYLGEPLVKFLQKIWNY